MGIKTFMIEPTGIYKRYLRRYKRTEEACKDHGYHNVKNYLDESTDGTNYCYREGYEGKWPKHCTCGYEFLEDDHYQIFTDEIFKRQDTGELIPFREKPVGSMWYATWMEDLERCWKGPDGRILMAMTPGGEWNIDSRASNCTMKDDNEHRCWVRTGVPPNITAGKGGNTCSAGAGSILCQGWHGFLRNGEFVK